MLQNGVGWRSALCGEIGEISDKVDSGQKGR